MESLTALSLLLFGPSIHDLGSPHYLRREAASRTLHQSLLAAPALAYTLRTTAKPEVAWRAERALWRAPTLQELTVRAWQRNDPDAVAEACCRCPGALTALCRYLDCAGISGHADSLTWIEIKPYLTGSRVGDAAYVLRRAKGLKDASGR